MSNILKSLFIRQEEDDKRVIDSNEMLDEKMQKVEEEYQEKQQRMMREALAAEREAQGETLDEEGAGALSEDEPPEDQVDYVAQAQEEAEQILADAEQQVETILNEARAQAQAMKTNAERDGKQQGYESGIQQAMQDMNRQKEEWEQEKSSWIADFQQQQESMERQLVDVICNVFEHVFSVQFGDSKALVLHLVDNALSNIEGSREFQIRVSESNYEYLKEHKALLQDKVGTDVILDIIMDPIMNQSQCLIETDGGVFDCSLDVEMDNLVKDIKSLDM